MNEKKMGFLSSRDTTYRSQCRIQGKVCACWKYTGYPVEEAYLYMTRKTPAFLQVIQLSKETLHEMFAYKLPLPTLLSTSTAVSRNATLLLHSHEPNDPTARKTRTCRQSIWPQAPSTNSFSLLLTSCVSSGAGKFPPTKDFLRPFIHPF